MADQYKQSPSGTMHEVRDGFSRMTEHETSSSTGGGVAEKAKGVAEDVLGRVEDQRGKAADQIDSVAGQVRDHAEQIPGGERTTEIAQKAADKVESAASFVRDADMSDITGDLERLVRQHPTGALLTAAAVGFLAGRAMRG